jgi:hypothetical protein
MGTTLTGTTPQDTYDSLIKVTDNGPLSGTAKYLSDGLGNDSVLALSTSRVGIGTATPSYEAEILIAANPRLGITATNSTGVPELYLRRNATTVVGYLGAGVNSDLSNVGDFVVLENRLSTGGVGIRSNGATGLILTSAGNVGIGSAAATGARLESVVSSAGASPTVILRLQNTGVSYQAKMVLTDGNTNDGNIVYQGGVTGDAQYVGIGLGSAVNDFQVTGSRYVRLASGTGGIQFNGDTAAANALDDYEEGTWTPVLDGATTSPTVTYAAGNTGGIYTKVGNKVTASFEVRYTAIVGGSGAVSIAGLPFTRRNINQPDSDHTVIQTYGATISGKYLTGTIGGNTSSINIQVTNSGLATVDLQISDLVVVGIGFIRGTFTYFV